MSNKRVTIDEEIKRFFMEIELRKQILPENSLPEYLQKLRNHVFEVHNWLDTDMLVRILSQIRFEAGEKLDNETWEKINLLIQDALSQIPYTSKRDIIQSYDDVKTELVAAITKLNTARNEFAHKSPNFLLRKYSLDSSQGKLDIRDLLRTIKTTEKLFIEHSESSKACCYFVGKQFEQMNSSNSESLQKLNAPTRTT
jgi:CRISPR/Cas system CSM-associated protein Csm2 small subunit